MTRYIIIILSALTLGVCILIAEPQYTVTLSNAVVKVAPDRTVQNAKAWAAGSTNTIGSYIETSAGYIYLCLSAGTNGITAPTHDGAATSGSTTLYRVRPEKRKSIVLSNVGTNTIYWTAGYSGSGSTPGTPMTPNGVVILDSEYQLDIYAGTNGIISVQEL